MKIDTLRSIHEAKPFRPFVIRTGSGESYTITHPEVIALSPHGNVAVIFPRANEVNLVDIDSITEVTTSPSAHKVGADDVPDITA